MLSNKVPTERMIILVSIFKTENISTIFYKDYYKAIQHLTDKQFLRAVEHLIEFHDSQFFPIPSAFLKAVQDSRKEVQVTPETNRIEPNYVPCPPEVKELRIVEIPGIDIQADGGTQVKNTKEIGKISLVSVENKGKNNRRMYFTLD